VAHDDIPRYYKDVKTWGGFKEGRTAVSGPKCSRIISTQSLTFSLSAICANAEEKSKSESR